MRIGGAILLSVSLCGCELQTGPLGPAQYKDASVVPDVFYERVDASIYADSGIEDAGFDSGLDAARDSGAPRDVGPLLDSGHYADGSATDAQMDAAIVDAALDGGLSDAGLEDVGQLDIGFPADASIQDVQNDASIVPDAAPDVGLSDTGVDDIDSGFSDAGVGVDSGFSADASITDAQIDAGSADANDVVIVNGKIWMRHAASPRNWNAAEVFCQNLVLYGRNDWRLPTVTELRSIIVGCSRNEIGGSCGIEDPICLQFSCRSGCSSCGNYGGPADGCYWAPNVWDQCPTGSAWFSSSSLIPDRPEPNGLWVVGFHRGHPSDGATTSDYYVRCIAP